MTTASRGWPRTGRPAERGAHPRDKRTEGEHSVGLFADRTRWRAVLIQLIHATSRLLEERSLKGELHLGGCYAPAA
jgi:hypothetical protein